MPEPRYLGALVPSERPQRFRPPAPIDSRDLAEKVRSTLPIDTYIFLLHNVATTGMIPVLDRNNDVVSAVPVDPSDRLRVVQSLVDKVMPAARQIQLPQAAPPPKQVSEFRTLTDEQLADIANGDGPLRDVSPATVCTPEDETDATDAD